MAEKATIEGELCVKEILKARGIKMKDLAEQIDIAPLLLKQTIRPFLLTFAAVAGCISNLSHIPIGKARTAYFLSHTFFCPFCAIASLAIL